MCVLLLTTYYAELIQHRLLVHCNEKKRAHSPTTGTGIALKKIGKLLLNSGDATRHEQASRAYVGIDRFALNGIRYGY